MSVTLAKGARLAILGPSPSGKSRLLHAMAEAARCDVVWPHARIGNRVHPEQALKGFSPTAKAEALTAAGLWEYRRTHAEELSPGQRTACRLLPCLAARSGLIAIDGDLDSLDLWTLTPVLEMLMAESDAALAIVTSRPDIAEAMHQILLLSARGVRAQGSPAELRRSAEPFTAVLQSESREAVRQASKALEMQVIEDGEELKVLLNGGLEDAARLALTGYGAIDVVTIRRPTLGTVLREKGP